jgi:hypothetical protein
VVKTSGLLNRGQKWLIGSNPISTAKYSRVHEWFKWLPWKGSGRVIGPGVRIPPLLLILKIKIMENGVWNPMNLGNYYGKLTLLKNERGHFLTLDSHSTTEFLEIDENIYNLLLNIKDKPIITK